MKIVIHGPLAGYGPDGPAGEMQSWGPDSLVELDDGDEKAVAWGRGWLDTPHATLVEDVKTKKAEPARKAEPSKPAGVSSR